MQGLMQGIANPLIADIGGAYDAGVEKRKGREFDETLAEVAKSSPGYEFADLMKIDPKKAVQYADAMGIPKNSMERIQNATGMVSMFHNLAKAGIDPKMIGAMALEQANILGSTGAGVNLLTELGTDLTSGDPEKISNQLSAMERLNGIFTGQQPKPGKPISAVDAEGNPVFMRDDGTGNYEPISGFTPPTKGPLATVTTPDGTEIVMGGSGSGSSKADDRRVDGLEVLAGAKDRISAIYESYNPELFTLPSRISAKITSMKSLANMDITAEERGLAERVMKARSDIGANQSKTFNEMAGSAVSGTEERRLATYVVGPNDSPVEIESKLKSTELAIDRATMRLNWLRYNDKKADSKAFQQFPLESIDQIARERRDELKVQFHKENPNASGEDVNKLVRSQLRLEFGL